MHVLTAAYDGRCALCDAAVVADVDEIVCVDGEWVHVQCAEDDGEEVEW